MALAETHDELAIRSIFPAIAIAYVASTEFGVPIELSAIAAATTPLAGLLLSPDLDIVSRPFLRWGILRLYWVPYLKTHKHRGRSHFVIFGSLERVFYLSPILYLALWASGVEPVEWVVSEWRAIAAFWVGCEIAAWVHLFADSRLFKSIVKLWKRLKTWLEGRKWEGTGSKRRG